MIWINNLLLTKSYFANIFKDDLYKEIYFIEDISDIIIKTNHINIS